MNEAHADPIPAAPQPVRDAVDAWRVRGGESQDPSRWARANWVGRFPEYADFLLALPDGLERHAVRRAIEASRGAPDFVMRAFLVSQIWGYGMRGYGPSRVRRILDTAGPAASDRLTAAVARVVEDGPVAGFAALAGEHRLERLGTSFATKFLFFMDPTGRALVLDEFVALWFKRRLGLRLRLHPMSPADYGRYLEAMHAWAAELGLSGEELEVGVFAAAEADRLRAD
jgi:hypothetical protein